jgi:DMSO/TMAO reductase YedYZ molybdopterin-dependent catalytic subunit
MYAQPAMTLSNSNTPGDSVSLAAMLSSGYPYNFDTVTAANNSGSGPTYTLTADSLEGNSPTTTYFTVGSTTGAVNIVKAIPRGTYTVTIKAADTGGTLPDEYITLTITVGA